MLRPKSVDLYLVYGCPKCGAEHTATREETIFPGGVLCYCGEKIKFEPIETILVRPNYSSSNNRKPAQKPAQKPEKIVEKQHNHDDVVALFVGMGYNRLRIVNRVKELAHLKEDEIVEILLKEKQ